MTRHRVALFFLMVLILTTIGMWRLPRIPVAEGIVAVPSLEDLRTHAVVSEAKRLGADPKLMLQISRHENWSGNPFAWSPNGCCVGIMQVHVRAWTGKFHTECGGSDLIEQRENACYGVLIFLQYLRTPCKGDTTCALRSYVLGPDRRHLALGGVYAKGVYTRSTTGWDILP